MTRVGALVVTHNSQRWVEQTLRSVADQSLPADRIVVIDDSSSDDSVAIVREVLGERVEVFPGATEADSRTDRIAANFHQGVRELSDVDVIVLGDHDDVWHADRIERQVALLEEQPLMAMVASDGRLVDDTGQPTGGTLRAVFPVPADFNKASARSRMRTTLRYSIATGGASAVRSASFRDVEIPPGWLHDRWWSLVATARDRMLVDEGVVIDYRVTGEQEVGLDRGTQDEGGLARAAKVAGGDAGGAFRKLKDLQAQLAPYATIETRSELSTVKLVRNLLARG